MTIENDTIKRLLIRIAQTESSQKTLKEARRIVFAGGGVEELMALGMAESVAMSFLSKDSLCYNQAHMAVGDKTVRILKEQLEKAISKKRKKTGEA